MGRSIDEFTKIASLVMDTTDIEPWVVKAAYSVYTEAPNIPASVLTKAIEGADGNTKIAYELVGAACAYDRGALVDYGTNSDVAEHAGFRKWANLMTSAVVGAGKKLVTTNTGNIALGTGMTAIPSASEKTNQLAGGGVPKQEEQEGAGGQ